MKQLFLLSLCLFIKTQICFSQKIKAIDLVGTWQFESPTVGSSLLKHFRFYKNGTYELGFNQYNLNNRIVSVEGKYKIENDTLFLTLTKRRERVGGKLQAGDLGIQDNEFYLDGYSIKSFKEPNSSEWLNFDKIIVEARKEGQVLIIVANKYYKISKSPTFYK